MQAIILAAGMGKRLGELTAENTKCMVEVNGIKLIDRLLRQLSKYNLSKIVIVVGYKGDVLKTYVAENYPDLNIIFIDNEVYDKTNNIYSLWLAREYMNEETLLFESDLIVDDNVIECLINSEYKNCSLVSKYEPWMDGTMVTVDSDYNIVNIIPKKAFSFKDINQYYKTVNFYKFSSEFLQNRYLPFLEAYIKVLGENQYYEEVLRVITFIDSSEFKALDVKDSKWYEIDDIQDLKIAETIFAEPKDKLKKIQQSYGGYWRYPSLVDFCYLVNPYFPTQRMIEEMKAEYEDLLRQYPSGLAINSLLAGKYFHINPSYVVPGNGAAEMIKAMMERVEGKIGITYPTFEEYPNRNKKEDIVVFYPANKDFSYTADDLTEYFNDKNIKTLLLINPDNPSGNYLSLDDVAKLIHWTKDNGIRLIIDESFVDFAEGNISENTLLKDSILEQNPHLIVVKSISKSYGVPGLRLGIVATADTSVITTLKKDVAIWNINSFGEYYMQIYGKYESDYHKSCDLFKEERRIFEKELNEVSFLRVIPSQANYFLCEVHGITSAELTLKLLDEHDILIKDCGNKKGFGSDRQYIRIAIRDREDNSRLAKVLKSLKVSM